MKRVNRRWHGGMTILFVVVIRFIVGSSPAYGQGDCPWDYFACGTECCWEGDWEREGEVCVGLLPRYQFGVVPQSAPTSDYDEVAAGNMKWLRIDMKWKIIERDKGTYHWEGSDPKVSAANQQNLHIVATLQGAPSWATVDGTDAGKLTTEGAQHWVDFVTTIASRYPSVTHWEPWNEPNRSNFWTGSISEYYAQILEPAAIAIRAVNSNNKIIAPTLSDAPNSRWTIQQFFDTLPSNATQHVDIIGQNHYKSSNLPVLYSEWHSREQIYNSRGFTWQPIWIMETGVNTSNHVYQADYVERLIHYQMVDERIQNVFIYKLRDGAGDNWGVLTSNGSPKGVYTRLQRIYEMRCECRDYPWQCVY